MCRLFGLLGSSVTSAEPWLVSADRSLLLQSNVSPKTAQRDGWGIGWYDRTRKPKLERGVGCAFEETERDHFLRVARRAKGPLVVGHLRKASNPMNLPHERLIGIENSQPFTSGGYLFAHNGSIPFPKETRPLLGRFEASVIGVNDSEVLFYLFLRHVEELGDPVLAYGRTVDDLTSVWEGRGRPRVGPYTGLNILFSRGPNELWAFCNWRGEHGSRLVDPGRPYYEMTYRTDAKQAIFGSEPFDSGPDGWQSVPNGTFAYAHEAHGLVAVRTGPLPKAVAPRAA